MERQTLIDLYEELEDWNQKGVGHCYMKLNRENGDVWNDCEVGDSYKVYDNSDIVTIPITEIWYTCGDPMDREKILDSLEKWIEAHTKK